MDVCKLIPSDETNNIEKVIEILTIQLKYYKELFVHTSALKDMLVKDCNEEILSKKMEERGLLIDKIISSKKYYDSIKECADSADNKIKAYTDKLLQEIQQILNSIVIFDTENIALIKNYIKDITFNLEKIQESKHLVNDLKKRMSNSPVFVDVCG
ncbi:MAG: hypothetical protein FJ266_00505 [Planctomycetes bacterium]|nr:hypothetical protein [Planctomycetota bacterium]